MLSPQNTSCEKIFFRQGMTTTILLTSPLYQQIFASYRSSSDELEKTDAGDLHREIKKENQSVSLEGEKTTELKRKKTSKPKKQSKPSKSFNHNFQKHAVTTIKKLGRMMCQNLGCSAAETLASQMWNIFQSSGITSKKILVVLFGQASLNSEKSKELFKSCYFGQICSQDDATVRAAQTILRLRLLELTDADVIRSHIFRSRKINQRDQFIAYFNEFISMLKQGPLTKFRLNPEVTHHIEQIIREGHETKMKVKRQCQVEYKTL